MKNINNHICSGCGGCVEVCPKSCIKVEMKADGFYRALADDSVCVECGLCLKKCAMGFSGNEKKPLAAYAAYNENAKKRCKSSSGGIFSAIAEMVLDRGGVVFGAAFDENMHLSHICIEDKADIKRLQGSKYLQSDTRGVYPKVKMLLENGREVLFVGTPCQIGGLKNALGKEYSNLLTCDLVCHGAPSAGLFNGYLKYLERKYGDRITEYVFRSKEYANDRMSYTVRFTLQNKKQVFLSGDEDPYTMRFISGALQAESCYSCPYASLERVGDITLADYWGYEVAHPELKNVQGVSLVLVNSAVGERLLKQTENLHLVITEEDKFLLRNNHLRKPASEHVQRNDIYAEFIKQGFSDKFYRSTFLPDGYRLYILKRRLKGEQGKWLRRL